MAIAPSNRVGFGFVLLCGLALAAGGLAVAGCAANPGAGQGNAKVQAGPAGPGGAIGNAHLRVVDLGDAAHATATDAAAVTVTAARDEWTSFGVQIHDLPAGGEYALRVQPLARPDGAVIDAAQFEAYQIVWMPVDVNRAGYVRHTGLPTAADRVPRALLPLPLTDGLVPLSALRDPARPTDPSAKPAAGTPVHVWVDVHVPKGAAAGEYAAACEVVRLPAKGTKGAPAPPAPVASLPVKLAVHDFALPAERHLQMLTQVSWDGLVRHHPRDFETVTPRLLNRRDPKYAGAVQTLDALVRLAQHHRLGVVVPRLQPTVKWPARVGAAPPEVDWSDFDSMVEPWFKGTGFDDGMGLAYWPLPEPDFLANYDQQSRLQYWAQAATHFDQNEWLDKTSVALTTVTPGRPRAAQALQMSAEAAGLLAAHRKIRVTLPIEDDQVQFAGPGNPRMIDPAHASRLLTSSPGLVSAPPAHPWPDGVPAAEHWLRTDLPGLVPYAGAGGDENDVRLWAWLAFLRQAKFVAWGNALPTLDRPDAPTDPNELIWFYPGHWFGLDEPVPTVQLKWLRRAQQDFEYLWLARERGEIINALQMAQLLTKPVEIQPGQPPEQTLTLMTGTTDRATWDAAEQLLAKTVLVNEPGKPADKAKQDELYLQTLQWARPQERPLLMGRLVAWGWDSAPDADGRPVLNRNRLMMRLGLDVYNASAVTPDGLLRWTNLPIGWEVRPHGVEVPALPTYQVRRVALDGHFDLLKLTAAAARTPLDLELTIDGDRARLVSPLKLSVPVAACERREGRSTFDGRLDDWSATDLAHDGPLVRMLDRPGVQRQALERAATASRVYTGWAADHFYVGFGVDGVSKTDAGGRNDVDYQSGRAWGEDLCEVLVQPVYANNAVGPILHVVCKPNGVSWVERKLAAQFNADPWEPFESTGVRYAAVVAPSAAPANGSQWTGEVAIPWRVLNDPKLGAPTLLRFNFAQHRTATGESASWAGPVDAGRDDAFTGVLMLRSANGPGLDDAVLIDRTPDGRGTVER